MSPLFRRFTDHAAGMRGGSGRSLRGYLIFLITLAVVAPLTVYLVLGGLVANSFFGRELAARGETVVAGVAESSLDFLHSAEIFINAVASDEQLLRRQDPATIREHLREELSLNDSFESLACIDDRGYQLASYPPDPNTDGLDLSDRDYAHPPIGSHFISGSYLSLASGRPVVQISTRLRSSGLVIVGALDLSRLSDFVIASAGPDWNLSIVDQSGTVIADHDLSRVRERVNIGNELSSGTGVAARRIRGPEGTVVAFSRRIRELGWQVVAAYNEAAFFTPLDRALELFILSALAAILLFGGVALFMARRMLADFDLLRDGVRAIRDRRYGEVLREPAFGEFRGLIMDVRAMETAVEERESQLTDMVSQRDTLLREVHHRVKNNMQIVTSLLALQRDSIGDDAAGAALMESTARIQALSLMHEVLYRGADFSRIDLGDYFREICSFLFSAYGASGIELSLLGEGVTLDPDRAIPLGLIVTEIVSNSLKHAFPEGRRGRIRLELEATEGDIIVLAADDGSGFTTSGSEKSLGLILIDTLVAQLRGSLTRSVEGGTIYRIVLPRLKL